jgi:hypothetical protein
MSAPETTKLQVNYKLADGTLVNIYAVDVKDLETSLNDIAMNASLIRATATDLGSAPASAVNMVQQQMGGQVVSQSAPSSTVIEEGNCKHGKLVYRTSKPGAPKEWKGWFCPSPQGTPDQCAPKFIR